MVPKNRIVILLFHPVLHKLLIFSVLVNAAKGIKGITLGNMQDLYPDFDIDVKEEQEVMLQHDTMVWQHPFCWYSYPSLMKEVQIENSGKHYARVLQTLAGMIIGPFLLGYSGTEGEDETKYLFETKKHAQAPEELFRAEKEDSGYQTDSSWDITSRYPEAEEMTSSAPEESH
jgi:glutathione-regulated potassium-efflux system ancillary protein KefG